MTRASAALTPRQGAICVEIAGAAYGIFVAEVQEVIGFRTPTRVFHAPAVVAGITSLRGEVLPVLDVARLFEASSENRQAPVDPRVVVVRELVGARRRAGLKVDALLGLRQIPEQGHQPPPETVAARHGSLIVGVVGEAPAFALLSVPSILDAAAFSEGATA